MNSVRSGLLVAWSAAWLAGRASYDEVVDRVVGDDEPHRVVELPGADDVVPLGWLLPMLRKYGDPTLVLPAPGDPRGLPAQTPFSAAALDAGEGVLVSAGGNPGLGVVPIIDRRGSAIGSTTVLVQWRCFPVPAPRPDPLSVPEAEHDLADAVRDTASTLGRLEVASWNNDAADAVHALRRGGPPLELPPGHDPRAARVLAQADRLAAVLAVADSQAPGGAVTGGEAAARAAALRPLAQAIRRARLAAYNAVNVRQP